jgi:hypothetical protein
LREFAPPGQLNRYTATYVTQMRRIISFGIVLAFAASAVILFAGWLLAKDRGRDFWSNYFLNVAAELLGLAIAVLVASIVAKRKLDDWLLPVINLIANLRRDQKINGPTAQGAVICAVRIFSEERFIRARPALSVLTEDATCKICQEPADLERQNNVVTCKHCLLTVDVSRDTAV